MKLISTDHNHKETGEILRVSYKSINRWAKACEKEGLNGLIPNFRGGKPSKLSDENNDEFTEKILRLMKRNKRDKSSILARKLGKHCKRESTENPEKIKQTKKDYTYQMIKDLQIYQTFQNKQYIVIFLDNARAHIFNFAKDIAEALNIYLLYIPEYSPWLDPVESVWDIHKKHIKCIIIKSKEMLIEESHKIFNKKCKGDSLQKNFKEKYLTSIC